MQKTVGLLALFLLATVPAFAQDESKLDVFGGYSYLHVSPGAALPGANTNGWEAQATFNLTEYVGATADFDGHYGDVFGVGSHDYNFLFGPTLFHRMDTITPFAHVLFGASHAGASGFSDTAFAWAIGGGVDWNMKPNLAVRVGQIDYLATHFANLTQNDFRYSVGVVFRFGGS
jgi:opacity protein-like surface antigen